MFVFLGGLEQMMMMMLILLLFSVCCKKIKQQIVLCKTVEKTRVFKTDSIQHYPLAQKTDSTQPYSFYKNGQHPTLPMNLTLISIQASSIQKLQNKNVCMQNASKNMGFQNGQHPTLHRGENPTASNLTHD